MRKKKIMIGIVGIIILLFVTITMWKYNEVRRKAEVRFSSYQNMVQSQETTYGTISYIEEGEGECILSCHGICGGYDQAYDSVSDQVDEYHIIAPSRFGYPGSDVPKNPSIENQVNAFVELLDSKNIDKVYVLGTSAGGAVAIKFALLYPQRTKGLILYCSGYPAIEKPEKELTYLGPPSMICYDFPMWFFSPLFGPLMGMDSDTIEKILPLDIRHDGMILDAKIANTDMNNHYEDYDMSNLSVPVLILHAKDDKLADYNGAKEWSSKIPDCTFVSFETGGHLMTGHSDEIEEAFENFIKLQANEDIDKEK